MKLPTRVSCSGPRCRLHPTLMPLTGANVRQATHASYDAADPIASLPLHMVKCGAAHSAAEVNSFYMRVLGIDCGGAYTGYGVVEMHSLGRLCCLTSGAIVLSPREPLPRRLARIFTQLGEIIARHQPDEVAIEEVFYALNVKSA